MNRLQTSKYVALCSGLLFLLLLFDMVLQGPLVSFSLGIDSPLPVELALFVILITSLAGVELVLFGCAIAIGVLFYQGRKLEAGLFALSIVFAEVTKEIIKILVGAPRPFSPFIEEGGYSFPSGHSLFAVLFWGLIAYFFFRKKRHWTVVPLIAASVAASRVLLSVHYINDVLAGMALGLFFLSGTIYFHVTKTSSVRS